MHAQWRELFLTTVNTFVEKIDPLRSLIEIPLIRFVQPLHDLNSFLASKTLGDEDQTLYLTLKLLALVMGIFYRKLIPRNWFFAKHAFNIFAGTILVLTTYHTQVIWLFAFGALGYFFLLIFPPKINKRISFLVFFPLCFVFTSYGLYSSWNKVKYGFWNGIMQMTCKIITIPFCLYDGQRIEKLLSEKYNRNREVSLMKRPSVVQYFGFLFFPGNVLNPPPFEFKHYVNSIESEAENHKNIDWKAILLRVKWTLFYIAIIVGIQKLGMHDGMVKRAYTENKSTIHIICAAMLANFVISCKLIFTGCLAEITCIVCGIGGKNNDSTHDWEDVRCHDPYGFEISSSVRTKIMSWNVGIEKWFRYYVYFRLPIPNAFAKRLITGFMAAFWHGPYIGIFIAYACLQMINQLYVTIYAKLDLKNRRVDPPLVVLILMSILGWVILRFSSSPFFLQTWSEVRYFHGERLKWGYPIICVVVGLVAVLIPRRRRRKGKKK